SARARCATSDGAALRDDADIGVRGKSLPADPGAIADVSVFHRRPCVAAAAQDLEPRDDVNLCAEGPTKICAMLDSALDRSCIDLGRMSATVCLHVALLQKHKKR